MTGKILVTYQIPKTGLKKLKEHFEVTYPEKLSLKPGEILPLISDYDGLLAAGVKIGRQLIEAAPKLKIISNYGVGYDNIDIAAATERDIPVTNTPTAVTEATAEIAFGLMLAVMRRIAECDRRLRFDPEFKWGIMRNLGTSLYGKTIGIIGLGRIGRALARRTQASGMKVAYFNRNRLARTLEANLGVSYLSLDDLLSNADVISIHIPLNSDSRHLIGLPELGRMKPTAFLINTARGPVIDEAALIQFLGEKRIAGAGLDVFEKEPAIPAALLTLDNVVITPHIGTETFDARLAMAEEASQNLIDWFLTGYSKNIVNDIKEPQGNSK